METKKGSEELYHKAREYFEAHRYVFKDGTKEGAIHELDGSKLNKCVTPDFSSEEAAKNTIMEIISILDSNIYQQCAKIADEFINKFCCIYNIK